ncbi:MAG: nucleotidyltransferase domain-containing protein [Chloroflexi bacterium]|nr:nucleotidyltransferase domain-containing protein [Chloroflexota bacterium]
MREKKGKIEIAPLEQLIPIFAADAGIVLAYLFGSYARGDAHALSDVDIALLLSPTVSRDAYLNYRVEYISQISRLLHDDRVDVVILNTAPPLLAHEAIKGRLLFERSPEARVKFVVDAQRQYLDVKHLYAIDNAYMSQRLKEGTFGQP